MAIAAKKPAVKNKIGAGVKARYSTKRALRVAPKRFTRAMQKNNPQHIADLEWQVKFTKMKLGLWRDLENDKWSHLEAMHKQAKKDLKEKKKAYFG